MRLKDQGKNSILLLNRSSVIAGALLLAILSIGLGYFIGFKTGQSGAPETEHIVEKPVKIPEEKRVLELPPPKGPEENVPTHQQETTQGFIPPESPKAAEQAPEIAQSSPQSKGSADKKLPNYWWIDKKSPVEVQKTGKGEAERDFNKQIGQKRETPTERQPEPQRPLSQEPLKEEGQGRREAETASNKPERLPPPQEKKSHPRQTVKQKQYAIQFGAFPSRQGAEELKATLRAKGVNAYIVDKGKDDIYYRVRTGSYQNKKEADRQALQLEKRTGLKGFVTIK